MTRDWASLAFRCSPQEASLIGYLLRAWRPEWSVLTHHADGWWLIISAPVGNVPQELPFLREPLEFQRAQVGSDLHHAILSECFDMTGIQGHFNGKPKTEYFTAANAAVLLEDKS